MGDERNPFELEQDYLEYKKIFVELENALMKIFSMGSMTEDEITFARHLTTYVLQTITNCVEIGMKKGMLPISKIDVWARFLGGDKKEFTYRLAALGGQSYEELRLLRISELLEKAVVQWADESWGGVIEAGKDLPKWVIEDENGEE